MNWKIEVMFENVWDYYYNQALKLAQKNDITGTLRQIKRLPERSTANSQNERKLAGLCLYRLGYYQSAYEYVKDCPEYSGLFYDTLLSYEYYSNELIQKVNNKEYKSALEMVTRHSSGSVNEYNIEGCLYVLCKQRKKAIECFHKALALDLHNEMTVGLLLSILETQDSGVFVRFMQRFFGKS